VNHADRVADEERREREPRPAPEVYITPAFDSVRYREEPISVRAYSDARNATVIRLTENEALLLASRLVRHIAERATA